MNTTSAAIASKIHTVNKLAKRFGRSVGRIRQISLERGLGFVLDDKVKIFSPQEVAEIRRVLAQADKWRRSRSAAKSKKCLDAH